MRALKHKSIEFSEVLLSELGQEMRFDSEYWEPTYLRNEDLLKSKKHTQTKQLAPIIQYGISIAMNETGIGYPILKMDNIMDMLAEDKDSKFADISAKTFQHFELKKFDVLFNRVNSDEFVGRTGIYLLDGEHTFASYLVKVDTQKPHTNCYLTTFLNCKYGKISLQRVKRRAVNQANINAKELSNLNIPLPTEPFQKAIQELVVEAQKQKVLSEKLYKEAEEILLNELGLLNWKPKTVSFTYHGIEFEVIDSISEKNFNEANDNSRFDAEFWEPQYEEVNKAFDKFPRKRIGSLVSYPISSGATPKAGGDDYTNKDNGVPFLRAVDLSDGRVMTSDFIYIKPKVHSGFLKRTQLKNNDILLSIAGTVGRCALFDHNVEANINQALSIIRLPDEKIVKRLYLVVLFNSYVGGKFIARTARQGLQTNLNLREVASLEIPIIPIKIQEKISSTLVKSFLSKNRNKNNLSIAKRAVEIFIEEDEKKAMKFIKSNTQ